MKILKEKIVKIGDKYQVQSEKGKNLGTYSTKKEAEDRLKQVEYFKHKDQLNEYDYNAGEDLLSMTPYMLRNDGELLLCGEIHPYIKISKSSSAETNLKSLESHQEWLDWYYNNTLSSETKALIDQFRTCDDKEKKIEIMNLLNDNTNQEFCRVRTSNYKFKYGGDNGQIYFRICSEGFNWFDLIWNVVSKFENRIEEVTVMKDRQTFGGKEFDYYYNHMPVEEFLTLKGNPIVEDLGVKKHIMSNITEDIEKHDTLNPLLWNKDNTLKPEVRDKLMEIANEFIDGLKEDGIKIDVDEIKIVGSNCSYNYTKDSDLDLHIVANTNTLKCPDDLYPLLYSAYRSIWNNKYDIDFYGIPVELYIETSDTIDLNPDSEPLQESNSLYIGLPVTMNHDRFKKFSSEKAMDRHKNSSSGYRYQYYEIPKDEFKSLKKQGDNDKDAFNSLQRQGDVIEENLIESISKLKNSNVYRTYSAKDVIDFFKNTNSVLRIIYDDNIGEYFIADAYKYTHPEIFKVALDNGYYDNLIEDSPADISEINDMVDFYGYESALDESVSQFIFVPDSLYKDSKIKLGDDGLTTEIKTNIGTFLDRNYYGVQCTDLPIFDNIEIKDINETEIYENLSINIREAKQDSAVKSNGVYSVLHDKWIKEPVQADIPDIDYDAFEEQFQVWENRYFELVENEVMSNEEKIAAIEDLIEDIYDLRKTSIATDGEYGIGNLTFKEFRNLGYLDNLKELKNEIKSRELSLEGIKK